MGIGERGLGGSGETEKAGVGVYFGVASVISLWIRSLAAKDDTKSFSLSHYDAAV